MEIAARQRSVLASKENLIPSSVASGKREPSDSAQRTPLRQEQRDALRERWDEQCRRTAERTRVSTARHSPTLAMLNRATGESASKGERFPGGNVLATQRALQAKHHEAKSRLDGVRGIGGGVSLWPAMDDMRLSQSDAVQLACLSLILASLTGGVFWAYHGVHVYRLNEYGTKLAGFPKTHPLSSDGGQEIFTSQLLHWHRDFLELQNKIHNDFDLNWSEASIIDLFSVLLYISGIVCLLYFLAQSMFSRNRLTPHRIKIWVSLLCVVSVWTSLSLHLLSCAQSVEIATQSAVHTLNDRMAVVVQSPLDLTQYRDVLLYWRTHSLPPTSRGVLSVLGLFRVQDVSHYLQYYSLPIITAICTPVVKLAMSLKTVYSH